MVYRSSSATARTAPSLSRVSSYEPGTAPTRRSTSTRRRSPSSSRRRTSPSRPSTSPTTASARSSRRRASTPRRTCGTRSTTSRRRTRRTRATGSSSRRSASRPSPSRSRRASPAARPAPCPATRARPSPQTACGAWPCTSNIRTDSTRGYRGASRGVRRIAGICPVLRVPILRRELRRHLRRPDGLRDGDARRVLVRVDERFDDRRQRVEPVDGLVGDARRPVRERIGDDRERPQRAVVGPERQGLRAVLAVDVDELQQLVHVELRRERREPLRRRRLGERHAAVAEVLAPLLDEQPPPPIAKVRAALHEEQLQVDLAVLDVVGVDRSLENGRHRCVGCQYGSGNHVYASTSDAIVSGLL